MPATAQRNIFITGAGAGIGAATVRLLAAHGHTVFAGVRRDNPDLAELPGVHQVILDVTDPASVNAAARAVRDQVGDDGLDAVINNAGVIVQGPLELVPPSELRRQFEVNTLGPAYIVQAFLPLLRDGRGRIINISAPTARVPIPFLAPIGSSKAALVSWSNSLRVELAPWNIAVVLVEPGATQTQIFAKAESTAQSALDDIDPERVALYREQLAAVAAASAKQKLGPVDKVAAVVVRAAETRNPSRHYAAGGGVRAAGAISHLPGAMRDNVISGALGLGKANKRAAQAKSLSPQ
ncbi:MAG: short-chain dehydrogenase/reductase [Aeromicrobium sp.]|nr:short-chain dehydrogenase/reductase [Aeromicrobium sp.]